MSEEATARTMEAFAGLLASRLGLEGARARAEDARSRMASLVDAGLSLGRELALDDLLSRIVQSARVVLGARYAALGVLDSTGTELARFVTAGLTDEEREAIGPLPRGRGILGVLIRDARPLRLERIGDDPRSSGFPPNHPPMESFLGVPVALRGKVFGNLYVTDKSGGSFTEEDEQIAMTLAAQAAVAVDNVRRYENERRRADEIESVTEVARAVLTTLDLDALLPLVARRARHLTGAGTVGVAVRDGDELVFRYAHGVNALGLEGSRGPLEMEDLAATLRTSLGAPAVEASALEVAGQTDGALVAVGWQPFDEGARRLLVAFSSQVAVALANARRVAREREQLQETARREAAAAAERAAAEGLRRAVEAQEAERARVARELHDESGQVLTALALHLRALEDDVGPGEVRERIAEMRRSLAAASSSLRELATRLRPSAVEEQGLADAIEDQAARLRRAGIPVDVNLRGLRRGSLRRAPDRAVPGGPGIADQRRTAQRSGARQHRGQRARGPVAPDGGGRRLRLRHLVPDGSPRARGHPRAGGAPRRAAADRVVPRRRDRRGRGSRDGVSEAIRILLVDDHAVLRAGLRLLLEREEGLEPVGEAATAEDALRALPRLAPDVVVIDIEMPGMGGIEGAALIRERAPDARILFLSMHDQARDVRRAFDAGADGYLLKSAADEDLVRAVRAVAAGERYVHPALGAALAAPVNEGPLGELTAREREVLRLLALGHTNQEIAERLIVSVRTVESHRAHVMTKLRVTTRAGLVHAALEAGLLAEED